jgi:hypothetical protein
MKFSHVLSGAMNPKPRELRRPYRSSLLLGELDSEVNGQACPQSELEGIWQKIEKRSKAKQPMYPLIETAPEFGHSAIAVLPAE